jgi:hypothetical protein
MNHMPGSPLLDNEDLRHLALWAADCAERSLPVFDAKAPGDNRPQEAIAAARAFARSGIRTASLRKVAWAALAAAREVGDPAAAAAGRAACAAAGTAYTHPIATRYQVNHILGPAAYSAQAIALRAAADEASVSRAEIRWATEQASPAIRQLVRRLPGRTPGKGRWGKLLYELDTALRG